MGPTEESTPVAPSATPKVFKSAENFDDRARWFSQMLRTSAAWKDNFLGAAYSTRLAQAVYHAEIAIEQAKKLLEDDGSPYDPTVFDRLYGRGPKGQDQPDESATV